MLFAGEFKTEEQEVKGPEEKKKKVAIGSVI